MARLTIVGATAILASALATSAIAQQVIYNPGYCSQYYPNANCQNPGPGNPYTGLYHRHRAAYRHYRGPAEVAAGTAGAVAPGQWAPLQPHRGQMPMPMTPAPMPIL